MGLFILFTRMRLVPVCVRDRTVNPHILRVDQQDTSREGQGGGEGQVQLEEKGRR